MQKLLFYVFALDCPMQKQSTISQLSKQMEPTREFTKNQDIAVAIHNPHRHWNHA
jgi:hypothetical protein